MMALEGDGTFHPTGKTKGQIYVPADVFGDSQFPFQGTTSVTIIINPDKSLTVKHKDAKED